jgi:hypothetical protein
MAIRAADGSLCCRRAGNLGDDLVKLVHCVPARSAAVHASSRWVMLSDIAKTAARLKMKKGLRPQGCNPFSL